MSQSTASNATPAPQKAVAAAGSTPVTTTPPAADDDAHIDLTLLLSCLSRDDLELLLVNAISRFPSLYNRLIALLSKPIDTATLSSSLTSLLSFTASPTSLTPELEPHVEQAGDYVKCGRVRAGVEVLTCVSEAVVGWVRQVRRGRESEMDDDYNNLESFFGLLVRLQHTTAQRGHDTDACAGKLMQRADQSSVLVDTHHMPPFCAVMPALIGERLV